MLKKQFLIRVGLKAFSTEIKAGVGQLLTLNILLEMDAFMTL